MVGGCDYQPHVTLLNSLLKEFTNEYHGKTSVTYKDNCKTDMSVSKMANDQNKV